jgi:SAM-dependent methyltransferase
MVNVGSGSEGFEGWVNIDSSPGRNVTCVRDSRTALPLATDSARGIFTEHFLEHLDYYEEAPRFLKECRRVLRPGGMLRIIVPDGGKYLESYCEGNLSTMASFSPLLRLDPDSDEAPFSIEKDVLPFRTKMEVVNFHFRQSGQHRFSYDFETLKQSLEECGFESIARADFQITRLPGLAIDKADRFPESLVVEAIVPS